MFHGTTSEFFAVSFRDFSFSTHQDISSVFPSNIQKGNVDTVPLSFKSLMVNMISTCKHLDEGNVLDILNDLVECHISDNSDGSDDF
jgi:hypothetical protein